MSADETQLERPPWSALTTTHAKFALGNDLARRYQPDVAPMAAIREVSEDCLQALSELMAPGDAVGVFGAEPVSAGRGLTVIMQKSIEQMVFERGKMEAVAGVVVTLTPADVPEMLKLVELTQPGPFAARTIELGSYLGIRSEGRLIAMAGERMKFNGFAEVSGVCTHPEHRGSGHASLLVRMLMQIILRRGDTPFLHTFSDNASAAALYGKLGFAQRRSLVVTVLRRDRPLQ